MNNSKVVNSTAQTAVAGDLLAPVLRSKIVRCMTCGNIRPANPRSGSGESSGGTGITWLVTYSNWLVFLVGVGFTSVRLVAVLAYARNFYSTRATHVLHVCI